MRGIDHHLIGRPGHGHKFSQYLVEHTQTATADQPVVDRLLRAVVLRRITPVQTIADYKDDAVFSPGIWWIGFRMNRSGPDVQILQMYS